MSLKFNIDRPKVKDEEIKNQQDFKSLVDKFKQQSLKKAQGDESWWTNKIVRYSTVIAGITVICTITYFSLFNNQQTTKIKHEEKTTLSPLTKSNSQSTKTKFVQAPSSTLRRPYSTYTVNNAKGGKIIHPTASKISIPKNSFVDKNGKSIIGDVTIEYKEFHDVGDVIAEGIPMSYDSAGKKYSLETAGMFDIRGYQNGEPVYIAPNKNLNVELASANDANRFHQYYLDTNARNWNYLKHDVPVRIKKGEKEEAANLKKLQALQLEIEKVIPQKIDSVGIVYSHKAEKLPRAKEPVKPAKPSAGRPNFKLDGSYEEFPELAAFTNVLFEVGLENKNYSNDLHEITWSDVKISQGPVKGVNYVLSLSYRNRHEKLIVYPVLTGTEFDQARERYNAKFEIYRALVEKRTADEKHLMDEMAAKQAVYLAEQRRKQDEFEKEKAKLAESSNAVALNELSSNFNAMSIQVKAQRIFTVSKFGIFNSDCPHSLPEGKTVRPVFVLNEKDKPLQPDFIYMVDHAKKTVYTLDKQTGYSMVYDPNQQYSICIFKNNKLFICSKAMFKESAETDSNKFFVSPVLQGSDNLIDFKKALEI
ncbi:MAG: hypothetical protein PSX36_01315 [bacterium]|nr:hypothetical protein [bacterium]